MLRNDIPAVEHSILLNIEAGEHHKTITTCQNLWEELTANKADRHSLMINVGGGVVTDMGGFVAATYKRGIDFVQVPTTLLAQVDAAIGGKVGVNLNHYKNLIGLFADPKAVFIHFPFIDSLPPKQILNGFAEVIKYALIGGGDLWKMISELKDIHSFDREKIITTSIAIKMEITEKDPFERDDRKVLNFGHTIGHALESFALSGSRPPLLHGEAVAAGMVADAYLSHLKCNLDMETVRIIADFIFSSYEKCPLNGEDHNQLIEIMAHDKKNRNGEMRCSLLRDIGDPVVDQLCSADEVKEALNFYNDIS